MGSETIETKTAKNIVYRILLLDNKYTVYTGAVATDSTGDNDFSAVASFDDLESARQYIEEDIKKR